MKAVLYVLNLAVIALAAEPACPVCSKYHYEEMLLERVLRNEMALEQTLRDIKETNTKVVDALKKLDNENAKVNIAIEAMERKQIVLEETLDNSINIALTNVSESLFKEMEGRANRIKGELQTPTIQFRAELASSITVNTGDDVVFARVEINEGQGYDKATGKFTATIAGLYNFAVHHCTQKNLYVHPAIVYNGKSLKASFNFAANGYDQCSSLQAFVLMSIGDKVWVRAYWTSYFIQIDGERDNTFSGVLIHV